MILKNLYFLRAQSAQQGFACENLLTFIKMTISYSSSYLRGGTTSPKGDVLELISPKEKLVVLSYFFHLL